MVFFVSDKSYIRIFWWHTDQLRWLRFFMINSLCLTISISNTDYTDKSDFRGFFLCMIQLKYISHFSIFVFIRISDPREFLNI